MQVTSGRQLKRTPCMLPTPREMWIHRFRQRFNPAVYSRSMTGAPPVCVATQHEVSIVLGYQILGVRIVR